jgi:hypothetical protein
MKARSRKEFPCTKLNNISQIYKAGMKPKSVVLVLSLVIGAGAVMIVPLLFVSADDLEVSLAGLKNRYMPGETIAFSVNVEGRLDRHCNFHTFPEVTIQEMPDESVVYSNRVPYTGASCSPTRSYMSSHWTYPIQRDNELYGINSQNATLSLNKAGDYLVTASFDKATVRKAFSISR